MIWNVAGSLGRLCKRLEQFIAESSTRTPSDAELRFEARFMWTTIESVGKSVARKSPSTSTIKRWASTTSKMLADHLDLSAD